MIFAAPGEDNKNKVPEGVNASKQISFNLNVETPEKATSNPGRRTDPFVSPL